MTKQYQSAFDSAFLSAMIGGVAYVRYQSDPETGSISTTVLPWQMVVSTENPTSLPSTENATASKRPEKPRSGLRNERR